MTNRKAQQGIGTAGLDPRTLPTADTVRRHVLADGTVLLVRQNPASPAVVINGLILAGAVDDPDHLPGAAKFMAECLTKGTATRTESDLYETAESLGASFGVGGGAHTVRFGAKCLAEDAPVLVDLLADVLRNPSFPEEEVEHVRGETLTDLEEREHDTRYVADLVYRRLAYPDAHPYSRPSDGTRESIGALSRGDLVALYERTLPRRPQVIAIVGAIEPDAAVELVSRYWAGSSPRDANHDHPLPAIGVPDALRAEHVVIPGKVQVDLAWGTIGPKRRDPDFVAASLANLVLGGFGLMGRLGLTVREEQGLAYYASSRLSGGIGRGPWTCIAGVAPKDFAQAVDTIRREVEKMCRDLVPENELDDSRAYLTGSLPLRLESNEGMASIMTEIELYELGWDYLLRFSDMVAAIGPEDVRQVMARYFDTEHPVLASAGPKLGAKKASAKIAGAKKRAKSGG